MHTHTHTHTHTRYRAGSMGQCLWGKQSSSEARAEGSVTNVASLHADQWGHLEASRRCIYVLYWARMDREKRQHDERGTHLMKIAIPSESAVAWDIALRTAMTWMTDNLNQHLCLKGHSCNWKINLLFSVFLENHGVAWSMKRNVWLVWSNFTAQKKKNKPM